MLTPTRYLMLRDSAIEPNVRKGMTVYKCLRYDYGLANDDTVLTGVKHISVTVKSDGGYPYFTVPERDLAFAPLVDAATTRLLALRDACGKDKPRHFNACCAIWFQHLAGLSVGSSTAAHAKQIREWAVEDFNIAVRNGFVDC